jgi:hypothetical protein
MALWTFWGFWVEWKIYRRMRRNWEGNMGKFGKKSEFIPFNIFGPNCQKLEINFKREEFCGQIGKYLFLMGRGKLAKFCWAQPAYWINNVWPENKIAGKSYRIDYFIFHL